MKAMTDHCVIDFTSQPPLFRCELCGGEQALELPIPLHDRHPQVPHTLLALVEAHLQGAS